MREQTQQFISNTNEILLQISDLLVTYAFSVFGAVIILVLGWMVAGYMEKLARKTLGKVHGVDTTLTGFLSQFLRYGILVIVLVMVLGQFGIQTASILAALGAVGLAIGLALQGTLQNIAAGIMLLILRPFQTGDYISTSDVAGTVTEVDLFTSTLTTYDGVTVIVPNSSLWNTPVTNFSRLKMRMHDFQIRISYQDNVQQAFSLIKEAITSQKSVLTDPEPVYFIAQLAENSVILNCRYWIDAAQYWPVSRNTVELTKALFEKHNITMPYPQMIYSEKTATSQ